MKQLDSKSIIPHLAAIAVFLEVSLSLIFSPVLEGKNLYQSDKSNSYWHVQEKLKTIRAEYGDEPLWTNSMFSGMPAYGSSVHI